MRHTLLPLHERILLRREYHVRITIVFLFMVCVSLLIGIASILPTYTNALNMESEILNKTVKTKDNTSAEVKEFQKNVARSLALLDSLDKNDDSMIFHDIISGLISLRGSLKFNNFSISKTGTTTYAISLQGFAPNRNSLLSFKSNFESLNPDNKVDLPVSELAKSTNIQFSIQLKENINVNSNEN